MTCLDREEVLKIAKNYSWAGGLLFALNTLKPVEARPVVFAEWESVDDCMTFCSNCYGLGCGSRFCPNCGAEMRENDERYY